MNQQHHLKDLAKAYGWNFVCETTNKLMWSFKKKDEDGSESRINYYHTTGTVTYQAPGAFCKVYKDIMSLEKFEWVLLKINDDF